MKTKKKRNKKNTTRNNSAYTPGRNAFGQKAETHLVVLERETAFKQIMDCLSQLQGEKTIEFTWDCSCFIGHEDEYRALMEKVQRIMSLKASMMGVPYYERLSGAA